MAHPPDRRKKYYGRDRSDDVHMEFEVDEVGDDRGKDRGRHRSRSPHAVEEWQDIGAIELLLMERLGVDRDVIRGP